MTFVTHASPRKCGDDDRRAAVPPPAAPVTFPSDDWLEAARKTYLRRYYDEHGDDYEKVAS